MVDRMDAPKNIVSSQAAAEGIMATKTAQGIQNNETQDDLQKRLESKGFKSDNPDRASRSTSLDSALSAWQLPTDRPIDKLKKAIQGNEKDIKGAELQKQLYEEAQKLENDPRQYNLRGLFQSYLFQRDTLRPSHGWADQRPVELSAATILLAKRGFGASHETSSAREIADAVGKSFAVLRGEHGWTNSGMEQAVYKGDSAQNIIDSLSVKDDGYGHQKREPISPRAYDAAIISALSCGDPYVAMELVIRANEVLNYDTLAQHGVAYRLINSGIMQQAYDMSPASVKDRYNTVFASIGEGKLANIRIEQELLELKKMGTARLRERIANERASSQESHKVANVDAREQALTDDSMQKIIDNAADKGQTWDDVKGEIDRLADRVVDGKVANAIAGELERRLTVGISAEEREKQEKDIVQREPGRSVHMGYDSINRAFRDAEGLKDKRYEEDLTQTDKQRAIGNFFVNPQAIIEANQKGFGFREMVAYMKHPTVYPQYIDEAVRDLERRHPNSDTSHLADMKTKVAEQLFPTVNLVVQLAQNPETRGILEREFGMKELLTDDVLDKVGDAMNKFIEELPDKAKDQLVKIESLPDEDAQVVENIAAVLPVERATFAKEKEARLAGVVNSEIDATTAKKSDTEVKLTSLQAPKKEVSDLEKRLGQLNDQLAKVKSAPVVGRLAKLLGSGMTASDKETQTMQLETQLDVVRSQLSVANRHLEELGPVSPSDIQGLESRLQRLSALQPHEA